MPSEEQKRSAAQPDATGVLIHAAAMLLSPDLLQPLWALKEKSGRTLGRRALSKALNEADDNLKLLAIALRQQAEKMRR